MVRNIVLLGGNSHPGLVDDIANTLGVSPSSKLLTKFCGGETRCEIKDSVRGKDVYIVQSGSASINDDLIELCIMISACKTGSAKRVTAIMPLFPYSRQPDRPYNKAGAPLSQPISNRSSGRKDYTFESVPSTPRPGGPRSTGLQNGVNDLADKLAKTLATDRLAKGPNAEPQTPVRSDTISSIGSGHSRTNNGSSTHDGPTSHDEFQPKPGHSKFVAQAGQLVADLLTCAGADHVITMDLHDPQYQGFFDIPVDNLYGRGLLQSYIQKHIPDYKEAVIVSPDAGGAKRATAICDSLGMDLALIHKERRPTKFSENKNASMMLVGDISNRVCILVDDLVDTGNTITRAAKLLKKEGALAIYALITHGAFSGDAIPRINASAIDKIVVTDSVPQDENLRQCPKLDVLKVGAVFSEAIRRVHHGESLSILFQHA